MTDEEIKAIGRKETLKIVIVVFAGILAWNIVFVLYNWNDEIPFSFMNDYILRSFTISTMAALLMPALMAYFFGANAALQIIRNQKSKLYVGFKTIFFISIICIQFYLLIVCLLRYFTTSKSLLEILIYDYIQGWTQFIFIVFWLPGAIVGSLLLGYFLGENIGRKA